MALGIGLNTVALTSLATFLCVQGTIGAIICEHLDQKTCAYAVSHSGKRCVLEKYVKRSGDEFFTCRTSGIEGDDKINNVIETDECIKGCGLDRKSLGISSDSLLDFRFTQKLCSAQCYQKCPNVIDLYFNLAAGEGVFLPKLCEEQKKNMRREMAEIQSSGIVAEGPIQAMELIAAPAIAPMSMPPM